MKQAWPGTLSYATQFSVTNPLWMKFEEWRLPALLASLAIMVVTQSLGVYSNCLVNIFAASLVSLAVERRSDWRIDWLGGRAIRHLGKISYGIYVFHYFIPQVVDAHWSFEWGPDHSLNMLRRFAVLAVSSVAVAEVSWRLIEKPILRLKDRVTAKNAQFSHEVAAAIAGASATSAASAPSAP